MASDNVNCGQQHQNSSQVWEEIATFPSRSVGINLPVNCFIFSSTSLDWFSIPDTGSWLESAGSKHCQSPFPYLSLRVSVKDSTVPNEDLFLQEFSPNISQVTEKKSVPQALIVIGIFRVAISRLHFQKEKVLFQENCNLLVRNLSVQGTGYNLCVGLFISLCFWVFFSPALTY